MSEGLPEPPSAAVAAIVEASLFEQFAAWGRWRHAATYDDGDLVRLVCAVRSGRFNGAYRVRLAPERADARIAETIAFYRGRDLPMFWLIGPTAQPADLAGRLEAQGAMHFGDALGMAAGLSALGPEPPLPEGVAIEPVRDAEAMARCSEAMSRAFDEPAFMRDAFASLSADLGFGLDQPWRHYLATRHGEPAGGASLLLGAAAGIYNVSTVAEARRQGIGTALTRRLMGEAQALGYRAAVLHASELGAGIYRRLGFRDYCAITWYGAP